MRKAKCEMRNARREAMTIQLRLQGMSCGHCVAAVRRALETVPGVVVKDVQIGSATVDAASDNVIPAIKAAVDDAGYPAEVTVG